MSRSSDEISEFGAWSRFTLPLRPIYSFPDVRAIEDQLRVDPPDVLHLHNPFPLISPAVIRAAKRRRIPVVQTVHNHRHVCHEWYILPSRAGVSRLSRPSDTLARRCSRLLPRVAVAVAPRRGVARGAPFDVRDGRPFSCANSSDRRTPSPHAIASRTVVGFASARRSARIGWSQ